MNAIAILLTVHNRCEKTIQCLRNISQLYVPNNLKIDIFLTDDGCTDDTRKCVEDEFPNVTIIDGDGSLYWNRGMFKAWEIASNGNYDYYLWLNDDTFLYDYSLKELMELSSVHNDQAITVGACQSLDHKYMTYGGQTLDRKLIVPSKPYSRIFFFNGNIVLIPRYVFDKIGNLDYYYSHCHGDIDYGLRAYQKGLEAYQCYCYVGECDRHENLSKWCNPQYSLKDRLIALKRPTGYPPNELYHFTKKSQGTIIAVYRYIMVYVRCFFPWIWTSSNHDVFLKK